MRTPNMPHRHGKGIARVSILLLVGFAIFQPLYSTRILAGQGVRPAPAPRPRPSELPPQPATRPPEHALPTPTRGPALGVNARSRAGRLPDEAAAPGSNRGNGNSDIGQLRIDIPDNVEIGTPFNIDMWIDFTDPSYSGSVKVFMEQTNKVLYEPRVFEVKPDEPRSQVKVTIVKAPSGLSLIRASANGLEELLEPLDVNFSIKLKPNNLDQALVSGAVTNVNFDFVNGKGEPVALDAPIKLTLGSPNLYVRIKATDAWADSVEFDIPQNYTSTPPVQVKPRWLWSPNNGLLGVTARITDKGNYSFPVRNENIKFSVVPRWWLPLVVAILGGIIFSLYQAAQDWVKSTESKGRRVVPILIQRILPGTLAGALAYFLVNLNILGIKIDTTALQGFLVLGFLFAYVGIDTILKLVTKKDGDSKKKDDTVPAPGPAPAG